MWYRSCSNCQLQVLCSTDSRHRQEFYSFKRHWGEKTIHTVLAHHLSSAVTPHDTTKSSVHHQETFQVHARSSSCKAAHWTAATANCFYKHFQMQKALRGAWSAQDFCPESRDHTGTRCQLDTSCTLHTPAAQQKAAGLNPIPLSPFSVQELQITLEFFSCGISNMKTPPNWALF